MTARVTYVHPLPTPSLPFWMGGAILELLIEDVDRATKNTEIVNGCVWCAVCESWVMDPINHSAMPFCQ
jgi:hypothetical protein